MRRIIPFIAIMVLTMFLLSACGPSKDPAARAVEDYLVALSDKDANALTVRSCADWEASAPLEYDSMQAVETRLEGLSCEPTGTDGDTRLVQCQGKLLATYNGEDQEFDLSVRTYEVVQKGGEYLVCGYR
jgi:hypothetical protein